MGASLLLRGLVRRFPGGGGFGPIELRCEPGSSTAIIGPSGAGKSTILRCIAGLDRPEVGEVRIDGKNVTAWPPAKRGVGMTLDGAALYEHLNVRENLDVALDRLPLSTAERASKLDAIARRFGVDSFLLRRATDLSAGERRRVALARALARDPGILLLDEPLAHLDPASRIELRDELRATLSRGGVHPTTILVTHDHDEAAALAERLVFLSRGIILQVGSPEELWNTPAHVDVARGIRDAPMNLLRDGNGWLGFRACDALINGSDEAPWSATGDVEAIEPQGSARLAVVALDSGRVRVELPYESVRPTAPAFEPGREPKPGQSVRVSAIALHRFDGAGFRVPT